MKLESKLKGGNIFKSSPKKKKGKKGKRYGGKKKGTCLSKLDLVLKKQIKARSVIRRIAQDHSPKVCSECLGKMIGLSLNI